MAVALEETTVSYEDLAAIERDFEDVELEIIRQQIKLTKPLYLSRQKVVSQIPNFWALALEQAPTDIDQYFNPADSALVLSNLTSLSVTHFEEGDPNGDPRSVAIRWEFAENDHFENKVLEKKLWYRRAKDGWTGLVSEPVDIKWKSKEKDLTGGLLGQVIECWEEEKKNSSSNGAEKSKKKTLTAKQKALQKRIEKTGMGGISFFAWFGFIGRRVTAEESLEATKIENERKEKRKKGEEVEEAKKDAEDDDDEEEEEEEDLSFSLEIFPDGDDFAIAITEDLWPGAIKYFTQAQEQDALDLSDLDFESVNEEDVEDEGNNSDAESAQLSAEEDSDAPPSKRQKAS